MAGDSTSANDGQVAGGDINSIIFERFMISSSFLYVHVTTVEDHPPHGFLRAVLLHRNLFDPVLHKLVAADHGDEVVTGIGHDGADSKHDAIAENCLEIIEAVILS